MTDFEDALRKRFRAIGLPAAPERLSRSVDLIVASPVPSLAGRIRGLTLLVAAAAVGVGGVLYATAGAPRLVPQPVPSSVVVAPSAVGLVDAGHVYSVSELLSAREDGRVTGGPITLTGYWSHPLIAHSCAAPDGIPGVLEIYCHDGEFGITERNEMSATVTRSGQLIRAEGPMLTPWVPGDLIGAMLVAPANGQPFPPVPITVRGHFDDGRATDCREASRESCADRFVIDEVLEFKITEAATPGVTPQPSPFPFDSPPAARFDASGCQPSATAAPPEFSFVGWMRGEELALTSELDLSGEAVYVAIAKEVVPLGDWSTVPGDKSDSQPMGRLVCFAHEWDAGVIQFDSVAGSAFRVYRDGTTVRNGP